ncbi:MAG: hypothetical protein WD467_02980 [Candidatus Saccharimonadales bacterium]
MKTLKESLYIAFGALLFILGIAGVVVFLLVNNFAGGVKTTGIVGSLMVAIFGWWLLRRGSDSTADAIGWIIVHFWS